MRFEGGDEVGKAFFEVAYGMFPIRPDLAGVEGTYERAFDAQSAPPNVETWTVMERQEAMCPFDVTLHGTERSFQRSWDETIFILDPLSGRDIIDYWNLRLFRQDVVPVNVHWLEGSRDLVFDLIGRKHRPFNAHGVMTHTTIHLGRSLDPQPLRFCACRKPGFPIAATQLRRSTTRSGSWMIRIGSTILNIRACRRSVGTLRSRWLTGGLCGCPTSRRPTCAKRAVLTPVGSTRSVPGTTALMMIGRMRCHPLRWGAAGPIRPCP